LRLFSGKSGVSFSVKLRPHYGLPATDMSTSPSINTASSWAEQYGNRNSLSKY